MPSFQDHRRDLLDTSQIGGTVSSQMDLGPVSADAGYSAGNTTVVRKLLGDNGQTIILLHNSPFDQQVWYTLFMHTQSLKERGEKIPTLISYDLRAHGTAWMQADPKYEDTNPNNHEWPYELFVEDLHKIYLKYNPQGGKVILVGYGFGGTVAQYYAIKYPQTIEHLFVLQATFTGITGLESEINYFSNWLAKNPDVTYLTIEQNYLDQQMCLWFQSTDKVRCPGPANQYDTYDTYDTVEYLLGNKLWRQASAGTHLQITKLVMVQDLAALWSRTTVPFPITLLGATLDSYSVPEQMKKDLTIISKSSPKTRLYIVIGKHGFTMIHPEYILSMLMDRDMSQDPLTAKVL